MYKIKNISTEFLIENGFRETRDGVFVLKFPISFYKKTPVIFCIAIINPQFGKRINIEVENASGKPYAMWYDKECDQLSRKFRKELDENISRKMHKIGARHYAD